MKVRILLMLSLLILCFTAQASLPPAKDWFQTIEDKQASAARLITAIGTLSEDGLKNSDAQEAQFAYNGFMARFLSLRADREALARKNIVPDEDQEKYSRQYDQLITELNIFLNRE